jgi:hypothetical protein
MSESEPFIHTFDPSDEGPKKVAGQESEAVFLKSPGLFESLFPEARAVVESFSVEQWEQLDKETKAGTGGGASFNDLFSLYERTNGNLDIDYEQLAKRLGEWHALWLPPDGMNYVDAQYGARKK